jgi:hypothetical protein
MLQCSVSYFDHNHYKHYESSKYFQDQELQDDLSEKLIIYPFKLLRLTSPLILRCLCRHLRVNSFPRLSINHLNIGFLNLILLYLDAEHCIMVFNI